MAPLQLNYFELEWLCPLLLCSMAYFHDLNTKNSFKNVYIFHIKVKVLLPGGNIRRRLSIYYPWVSCLPSWIYD